MADTLTKRKTGTRHVPVLLAETLTALQPGKGRVFVDGTLGGGGHSGALLEAGARVLALDWDARALQRTEDLQAQYGERLVRVCSGYGALDKVLHEHLPGMGVANVHGVLLDLGFSSDQLDDPARGLSYHVNGPLDMRLDSQLTRTAADILNRTDETTLANIFYEYGEEPKARHLARAVVTQRKSVLWQDTQQLKALVETVYPPRFGLNRAHPAARIFQALRIAVNGELDEISAVLPVAAQALAPGGRLAVITFQPSEDRLVKSFFRKMTVAQVDAVGRQVADAPFKALKKIEPKAFEIHENPRARSAKLRVLERVDGAADAGRGRAGR